MAFSWTYGRIATPSAGHTDLAIHGTVLCISTHHQAEFYHGLSEVGKRRTKKPPYLLT